MFVGESQNFRFVMSLIYIEVGLVTRLFKLASLIVHVVVGTTKQCLRNSKICRYHNVQNKELIKKR